MLHILVIHYMRFALGLAIDMGRAKKDEDRATRFKRIAEKRTNQIIRVVRLLGNCSNKSSYSYNEREVSKIFTAIDKELKEAKARFTFKKEKTFKL